MTKTKTFSLMALLALVACTDYKVDHGDPDKCLAGQVFKDGKCIPAGCTQDIHCDDGNPCNGLEECIGGRCSRGGVIVESCDDGIGCTDDMCDKGLARCIHVVNDELCEEWEQCDPQQGCVGRTCSGSLSCSDGLVCNGEEICDKETGTCIAGALSCDDNIACTVDYCSEPSGCQLVPDHKACPTGQICNLEQGCIELPCDTDAYCDDGSHCNGIEKCVDGKCVGGAPTICDDQVDCTVDRCDESARGCVFTPDHNRCRDNLFCNGVESCDANTGCVSGAAITCRDDVTCTEDSCNENLDACQYRPENARCASTEYCDPLNDCVRRPGCSADQDCPAGMVCMGGQCIQQPEEPRPMDGDDGGMPADDGDDGGYGDDGGCCPGDDGGDDGCCMGDDGGMPGDDGGDLGADAACIEGTTQSCNTGQLGQCAMGMDYCEGGTWTGCQQLHFSEPELCDTLDNNCNGVVDDNACACLKACIDGSACDWAGGETCAHLPGFFNACVLSCANDFKCPASSDGTPRVCAAVPAFGMGPICVCETERCPQDCVVDSDCYPYGLTSCTAGSCTSPCASSLECPLPYQCEPSGMCECDSGNIGSSCLGCGTDFDCEPPAPCTYRNYETDPATIFKECEYPCTTDEQCPSSMLGLPLYCRWGEGNTPDRCACEPEMDCLACIQMNPDPCEPFSMTCSTITDQAGVDSITGCTAPCQNSSQCPAGWYCFDNGMTSHGWCIEAGCNCVDVECGPNGVPSSECPTIQPGFSCIPDNSQEPPIELCTANCLDSRDCPLGYHCDDGTGTGGSPVCRCSLSSTTVDR